MQIILLEKVEKLGNVGETVTVKDGYARNYLIPQEKALRATKDNVAYFEQQKASIEKKDAEKRTEAEQSANKLKGIFVNLIMQAGEDGRLFGSVKTRTIAGALDEAGQDADHKDITLNTSIKYLGVYEAHYTPHAEVSETFYINVARSNSEAEEAKKEFLNPTKKKKDEHTEEEHTPAAAEDAIEEVSEVEALAAVAEEEVVEAAKEAEEQAAEEAAKAEEEAAKKAAEAEAKAAEEAEKAEATTEEVSSDSNEDEKPE